MMVFCRDCNRSPIRIPAANNAISAYFAAEDPDAIPPAENALVSSIDEKTSENKLSEALAGTMNKYIRPRLLPRA